ncbi:hypothetical protein [Mycobacterium botniense]|jgi:hypothetical protein|uniref:Uncharacterized protein n=1 Tax=Mycobacterium botniense TaxID=84962 RepID=A0A7I9XYR3_9MYCO|nr:hypothetical protein [Mycobacterium botniense]GFG74961.1 hypothetical protein MBOT_23260 [Mycobacterium botniense]
MRNGWKWLGLAGVVGVAAGGVLVIRDQRKRNAYTPEEIRDRLHQRLAELESRRPATMRPAQRGEEQPGH